MSRIVKISRRDFLKTGALVGGGLILGFSLPVTEAAAKGKAVASFLQNAFIRIGTDDTVTIIVNKSEMGQGVYTALPMLIAEELECDWSKIRIESAPVGPEYNHTEWGPLQGTGGSSSVRSTWNQFRKAGAAARTMLMQAAAETWKVPQDTCRAEKGFVINGKSKKRLSYGALAERASKLEPPKEVVLKSPDKFKVIGRPTKRLDTPGKVSGKALFGIDAGVKGMLIAVVERPPVFGGKVGSFDAGKAKKVAGVVDVLQVPSGVAVVASDFASAEKGREALEIKWDEGENAGLSTAKMRNHYAELSKTPGTVAKKEGDAVQKLAGAAKTLSAEFEVPYLAHATMEPLNCLVDLREDSCEIWTGTQFQTVDRNTAAAIAGLKNEQVKIHTMLLGGGFGRRANPRSDFVSEAVHIAKGVKRPVKVIWTREDDMKGGFYRPMWYDRISAGLDEKGTPVAWRHTIVGQSIVKGTFFEKSFVKNGIDGTSVEGAADIPYDIPNIFVDLHTTDISVPVLWWRSVGHSHTAFVVESFIDELAHVSGKDPFEFRMGLLGKNKRHKAVLELAAKKAEWGNPLPEGRGRGIAVHSSFGSYVAEVAEVSVDRKGEVTVHKVTCVIDCGRTVNPSTVEAQMESAIAFGLSATLFGEITFKDGRIEQSNFNDYPVLRMREMPKVDVSIISSTESPQGVGEPGVPPVAPAVCNAIFSLTGKRIRSLPIKPEELKA
ncbi:MAG: xanthine dehydrogenase family protein molybdopterin-binding subunit [Nitrospiraceae bacterium]|nr:xanthine dehydrogenase family protein molybdopterin-binding subunit [Nitrospiraceae bacterium]